MSECNHFWEADDFRRGQCSKCGEIEKSPCREPECVALQARIEALEKASNTAVADYKRWVLPQYGAVDGLDALAALLQEPSN